MAQTGYVSGGVVQPDSALQGIRGMVVILPAILLAGGIVFALRYPLSRKEHAEIRAKLAARRAAAAPD
jgi:Na+/melibiose symporter-like transporter